ncbi:hypothetical protein [Halomonas sp. JS92-SW72]|uniref:hypothetical protein n=1 Tax=Halomonas sp. JS92-SW72 TaxID=2306583 RepID=UPI000E5AAD40|nr:hypothetical protein [Halomonas sp. JS92-SW72]AXY43014.1 hypothetical protein D1793_12770 [Halomonas sp. JS92-SW72]
MTRPVTASGQSARGGRLLALLLALLLAVTALSSHGAMESHQADCGLVAQVQLLDAETPDEHRCASCAALPPSIDLATAAPHFPALAPALAVIAHRPLPPRRPPRT